MRFAHGFIMTPLIILAIKLGLVAAVIGGAVFVWHSYTSGLIEDGHTAGMAECTTTYTLRDNRALEAALKAQTAAEARATRLEQDAAKAQETAMTAYKKGKDDATRKTEALVAAARAGSLVLTDPGARAEPARCPPPGPGPVVDAPGGNDAAAGGQLPSPTPGILSPGATVFLAQLTGEADDTARALTLAQARILSDVALCNAP